MDIPSYRDGPKFLDWQVWVYSRLISVSTVHHSVFIFWMHFSMTKQHCSTIWMITATFQVPEILGYAKKCHKIEPHHEKTCLCHMRTTETQINLRIHTVISVFVHCLDSILPLVSISDQISYPLSVLELSGERGGSVVECRTSEREVGGSKPTATVLCPWARHFTPRKYWLITQEAVPPSRHDWKIVDWDIKPQHKQKNFWSCQLNHICQPFENFMGEKVQKWPFSMNLNGLNGLGTLQTEVGDVWKFFRIYKGENLKNSKKKKK